MTPPSDTLHPAPVAFDFTWRRYRISLAATPGERDLVYDIRHRVFYLEMLGRPGPDGTDRDAFDDHCDHLLIREAASDAPVGTCRFASSRRCTRFYSQTEFAIDPFLARAGGKMEMGRTCFLPAHRNNLVIAAFGRGLGAYARATDARWMFGCTSVATTDPATVARVCRYLATHDHCLPETDAIPHDAHRLPGLERALAHEDPTHAGAELLPPLLRGYLRAGARVSCHPCHDPEFACVDFFTTLDLTSSNAGFMGRYTA